MGRALVEGSWVGQERGRDEDSSMTSTGLAWQLSEAAGRRQSWAGAGGGGGGLARHRRCREEDRIVYLR